MTPVRIWVSLALVLALGACSSSSTKLAGSKGGANGGSAPGGASQTATGSAHSGAQNDVTGPGAHQVSPPPSGRATPSNMGPPYGISASVNDNVPWECHFKPGDSCKIPFTGAYYVYDRPQAFIVFKAYENGSKTPAKTSSPLPAPHGASSFQANFPYTVGLTARTVTFEGFLVDDTGKVLAAGRPHEYNVTPA